VIHIYRDGVPQHSTTDTNFDPNDYRFKPVKPRHLPGPRRNQSKQPPLPKLEFSNRQDRPIVKIPMKQHNVYIELDSFRGDNRFRRIHLWLLPLALIALLTALYALLRKSLSPISDIKAGVAEMTAGNLSHRIPVKRDDDLGQLAGSVNGLTGRIQELLDAKRALLLSVSHELRSPLTRAHLATEMLPESTHRSRLLDELRLLDSLIGSLIESERLQSEHTALNLADIDLKTLIEVCIQDVKTEFGTELERIDLTSTPAQNWNIQGDEVRLRLLFRNLLNNAVQHGKTQDSDQAAVAVNLSERDEFVVVEITDQGPGVADRDLSAITDAFYRPDPSRTHGTGGVGLGLSLAKIIAEAHGGTLTMARGPGEIGLVARVVLSRT